MQTLFPLSKPNARSPKPAESGRNAALPFSLHPPCSPLCYQTYDIVITIIMNANPPFPPSPAQDIMLFASIVALVGLLGSAHAHDWGFGQCPRADPFPNLSVDKVSHLLISFGADLGLWGWQCCKGFGWGCCGGDLSMKTLAALRGFIFTCRFLAHA